MSNYAHKKLIERIIAFDSPPDKPEEFAEWIKAGAHLEFLRANAREDEVVIYALGEYSLIHSAFVPNGLLSPPDRDDLLGWNFNAYKSIANYVSDGNGVWLERGLHGTGTRTFDGSVQPVFARTFEGWKESGRSYLELNQEYIHLTGSHWRPEKRAFCRFDGHGDLEHVVTVTNQEDKGSKVALVTFKWEPLEEYLAASESSLVRMFDFTLLRKSGFGGWSRDRDEELHQGEDLFYRQQVDGSHAAYTQGVQIIRPRRAKEAVHTGITDGWFGGKDRQHTVFIAYDWRNKRVRKISTDPAATTNYFESEGNTRPFELSPAFFKPEVLSKYKTDRDKYTVGERDVSCRAAWNLKAIDVNEAGQVHAYIAYLRNLPYAEQLHWLSFNEEPKAGISERAVTADFKGEWTDFPNPLRDFITILRHWNENKVAWWSLRDEKLMEHINTPLTSSRDTTPRRRIVCGGFAVKGNPALLAVVVPSLVEALVEGRGWRIDRLIRSTVEMVDGPMPNSDTACQTKSRFTQLACYVFEEGLCHHPPHRLRNIRPRRSRGHPSRTPSSRDSRAIPIVQLVAANPCRFESTAIPPEGAQCCPTPPVCVLGSRSKFQTQDGPANIETERAHQRARIPRTGMKFFSGYR